MAQDTRKSNNKSEEAHRLVTNAPCLQDRPARPTTLYFINNWQCLQYDPTTLAAFDRFSAKILGDGIVFQDENTGDFYQPSSQFQSVIKHYLMPALARALRWFFCGGYVVWALAEKNGVLVPFVPDPMQLKFKHGYDKVGLPELTFGWMDEKIPSQLYVYNNTILGISPEWIATPMDRVSYLIYMMYFNDRAHSLILDHASRPPVFIQSAHSGRSANGVSRGGPGGMPADDIGLSAPLQAMIFNNSELIGLDDQALERLQSIKNATRSMDTRTGDGIEDGSHPPWVRHEFAIAESPANWFIALPEGMQGMQMSAPHANHDYPAIRQMYQTAIEKAIEDAPVPTAGAGAQPKGKEPAAAPASKGTNLAIWMDIISDFATDVVRNLYDQKHLCIFDTKPTFAEQNMKQEPLTKNDLFDDDDDQEPTKKPAKKRKVSDISIRVLMMPQVTECRDNCKRYQEQGGMSKEKFESIYPPPEKPEEKPVPKPKPKPKPANNSAKLIKGLAAQIDQLSKAVKDLKQ